MTTMKKAPNDVDRHVGGRVRMRRILVSMSQEKLGEALGITFQQVQKYEKGVNRISASRLQQIADKLGVTIDYFYQGMSKSEGADGFAETTAPLYEAELMSAEGLRLLKAFTSIPSPEVRRKLLELAQSLSRDGNG